MAKNPKKPVGRGPDMFLLRFPEGMRDQITKAAKKNNRSINAEVIDRVERTFADEGSLQKIYLDTNVLLQYLNDRSDQMHDTLEQLVQLVRTQLISKEKQP